MDSGMEKHTISVGTDVYGETVAFTANKLGTAEVNGGNGAPGGLDLTIYRLPDNTYRAPVDKCRGGAYPTKVDTLKKPPLVGDLSDREGRRRAART